MRRLYGFIILAALLFLSSAANAAEYGFKRVYYTGQTSIVCNGDTIRLPKFEYDQARITRRGPFLVFDEANCTPNSFMVRLESAARCTGKPICLLAQFAKFPAADVPELSGILGGALPDQALNVEIISRTDSAYFLPMSRGVLPRLIWWGPQGQVIYILSTQGVNSNTTVNALAATVKAYIQAGEAP